MYESLGRSEDTSQPQVHAAYVDQHIDFVLCQRAGGAAFTGAAMHCTVAVMYCCRKGSLTERQNLCLWPSRNIAASPGIRSCLTVRFQYGD